MKKRTMLLLWLGAAISISEIYTGGLIAPLGFAAGAAAILLGHAVGALYAPYMANSGRGEKTRARRVI
jgi:purine-cytosine permease-like protein